MTKQPFIQQFKVTLTNEEFFLILMHGKTIAIMVFHDRYDFTINDKKLSGDRNQ